MPKVYKSYEEGRKSPFKVAWRENGERFSRFFETEELRDNFLKTHTFLEEDSFHSLFRLSKEEISDIAQIKSAMGEDISFRDLWLFWKQNHRGEVELITKIGRAHV